MCGRFFLDMDILKTLDQEVESSGANGETRSQSGPGSSVVAWISGSDGPRKVKMRWGFKGERGGLIINARIETVRQKPMFSALASRQRCAVPASGYYEWRRSDHQKYSIVLDGYNPVYLAGLYRRGEAGMELVILTRSPTASIRPVHNRMPVILRNKEEMMAWLDGMETGSVTSDEIKISADGDEQLRMPF